MSGLLSRSGFAGAVAIAVLLAGCSSTPLNRAPVEDRNGPAGSPKTVMDPRTEAVKQPPGFENAGKPGFYTVKPGDTLIRIGLENGQSYKDIRRWNALDDPNKIEVGQVLRVVAPPVTTSEAVAVSKPVTSPAITSAPLAAAGSSAVRVASAPSMPASAASAQANAASAASVVATASAGGEEDLGWVWPSSGAVVGAFDEAKNKGVDIGGTAGDAVLAASDGKVVYAGAGLRGYGNLIILKHNNTYLSAYAHNRALLVKEDQTVKKGQKIAEMGDSDAERVKLHFEVRKQGKPVDPVKYLPPR